MRELIRDYKLNRDNYKQMEGKYKRAKSNLSDRILSVIKIMHDIEYKEIKKLESDKKTYLNAFPRWSGNPNLIDLDSVSIKDDMMKVRYGFHYSYSCGDEESWHSIKIPISYFNLNYKELNSIHTEFSIARVLKIYNDKNKI
jgi:hypothetical protein